ncbi:unnamed protein product [marine sediment metagenome]|uniref:Uncharacterized protein n=1 Tax=marine sediment metagenome TaxID=412755 RepID=X1BEM6_9ZZZZ
MEFDKDAQNSLASGFVVGGLILFLMGLDHLLQCNVDWHFGFFTGIILFGAGFAGLLRGRKKPSQ